MADIRPFCGIRYDPARTKLGQALCPPYDAIPAELARRLRRGKTNAIHLELPEGQGAARYRRSAVLWKKWSKSGLLLMDLEPSLYICEQSFTVAGRRLRRTGFLAAMGVSPQAAKSVVRHEKTLSKPKADRLKLLKAVRVNLSPIFGIAPDPGGALRRALAAGSKGRPDAAGRGIMNVDYRFWRVSEPELVRRICGLLSPRDILIADGHHRYEVGKNYYAQSARPQAASILIYLCPEEDAGLVVLPTHRIVAGLPIRERAEALCRVSSCRSRGEMLKCLERSRNPYAFGLFDGGFRLAEPKSPGGCRSGLCVEWIGRHMLGDIAPDMIRYTPDAAVAEKSAREIGGAALFVKPMRVSQVRRAVSAVGLLPQKSTYFYPKIATGLVFKEA